MKKFFTLLVGCTALLGTAVQAETVKSGSKFPIVVEVYKGSATCNPKASDLENVATNAKKNYKKAGIGAFLKQGLNGVMRGSGCELIGKGVELESGQTLNIPQGAIIVAYKDMERALKENNKLVNPLPAICRINPNASIVLETRKSEGLRGIIGMAGDGGLKCSPAKGILR